MGMKQFQRTVKCEEQMQRRERRRTLLREHRSLWMSSPSQSRTHRDFDLMPFFAVPVDSHKCHTSINIPQLNKYSKLHRRRPELPLRTDISGTQTST